MDLNVLKRFLNHSASEEDYKKINKWRREEPANSTFLFSLEEIWYEKRRSQLCNKDTSECILPKDDREDDE